MSANRKRGRNSVAAALIATSVVVASADAATAPLQAPSGNAIHALATAKVAFTLPTRFVAARSINTNAVMRGGYDHVVAVGSLNCRVRLQAVGALQHSKPTARQVAASWGAARFGVSSSGTTGDMHWVIGKAGYDRVAYAYGPAPKRLATGSVRFVVYKMLLAAFTKEDDQPCEPAVAADRSVLPAAIKSAHSVNG